MIKRHGRTMASVAAQMDLLNSSLTFGEMPEAPKPETEPWDAMLDRLFPLPSEDVPCASCGHSISDGHGKDFCGASNEETGQGCSCGFYESELEDFRAEQDERELDPPDGWDVLQSGGF